jgi:hypothetical protein
MALVTVTCAPACESLRGSRPESLPKSDGGRQKAPASHFLNFQEIVLDGAKRLSWH